MLLLAAMLTLTPVAISGATPVTAVAAQYVAATIGRGYELGRATVLTAAPGLYAVARQDFYAIRGTLSSSGNRPAAARRIQTTAPAARLATGTACTLYQLSVGFPSAVSAAVHQTAGIFYRRAGSQSGWAADYLGAHLCRITT